MDNGKLMTPEQVAELLSISKATLCRLTNAKRIPHLRLGERVVRFDRDAIAAWIKARQEESVQHG